MIKFVSFHLALAGIGLSALYRCDSKTGPFSRITFTSAPFWTTLPSLFSFLYSSLVKLVNPHLLDTTIFCLPGNLFLALLNAYKAFLTSCSLILTE